MAVLSRINPDEVFERLQPWLNERDLGDGEVRVEDVDIPSGSGGSNETVFFTAVYEMGGREMSQRMVARVEPAEPKLFPAYDFERQFELLESLAEHTAVPVPRAFWCELGPSVFGSPFMIMEFVEGRIAGDDPPFPAGSWVLDLSAEEQARLHDNALSVLAKLHAADAGHFGFLDRPELGGAALDQELSYYRRYYEWSAGQGTPSPTVEAAFEWLEGNRPPREEPHELVVSWGDARIGNMLIGGDLTIAAALDWETACLARPAYDVSWWLFLHRHHTEGIGAPSPPGWPSDEEVVARYEELSGRSVEHLDYYIVLSGVRLATMMVRADTLMKHGGLLPSDSAMGINNPASQLLARQLDLPAPDAGVTTSYMGALKRD